MTQPSLDDWLSYIESQHPTEIELGLERGAKVLAKLNISRPKAKIITVAGTNGKGSTCTLLTQFLSARGHSVGTYTSPHFIAFNERVALNNIPCDDALICQAFETIEALRGDISLTYFEFSTLAALWIFDQQQLDYWVLEVGLGGRLDSVNMVDTDVAVVTSIALDHTDWLGDSLEVIAQEKVGIARAGKLLVSGVVAPPESLADTAKKIGANLYQKGVDFHLSQDAQSWSCAVGETNYTSLPMPQLPLENAATVVAVLTYMGLAPEKAELVDLLTNCQMTGRFQQVSSEPLTFLDVAHNPEAAQQLATKLAELDRPAIAVCGMLKDKDIASVVEHLSGAFSAWFCADLNVPRGSKGTDIINLLPANVAAKSRAYGSVALAYEAAYQVAQKENCALIVFGSFVTVTDYLLSQRPQD